MNNEIKEILDRLKNHYVLGEEQDTFLLDYITNLEQENERLKEDNYELQKYINEEEGFAKDENRELGLRIDKAIELIKNDYFEDGSGNNIDEVLNILQGSDK